MYDSTGNWTEFSTLKFYVSNIYYSDFQGQKINGNQYQLIDLEMPESLVLPDHPFNIDQLGFMLGIDSATNVAGILDGPLDPINGMYWTWNSGYINFKLEGSSNLSNAPKNQFEYHIGGYLTPFATSRELILPVPRGQHDIVIEIHLDSWLEAINIEETNSVMMPGAKAVQLSDELLNIFKVRIDNE